MKEPVMTARLDRIFAGRKFDFIKIDVQGAELDVLNGGADLIRQADYVLIEVPIREYNEGAAPVEQLFEKLRELGFRCADLTEFHRLKGIMNGDLLQIDVLFERNVARATQNCSYTPLFDRAEVLAFRGRKRPLAAIFRCSMSARPSIRGQPKWSMRRSISIPAPPRRFIFAAASTTPKVGTSSLATSPSTVNSPTASARTRSKTLPIRRWRSICCRAWPRRGISQCLRNSSNSAAAKVPIAVSFIIVGYSAWRGSDLVLVPKIPVVDFLDIPDEAAWRQDHDRMELQIYWRKGLRYTVLNNDFLGPTAGAVIDMYKEILTKETA